jgi:hypothetical protein
MVSLDEQLYKEKYLKYKIKYIKLKEYHGGASFKFSIGTPKNIGIPKIKKGNQKVYIFHDNNFIQNFKNKNNKIKYISAILNHFKKGYMITSDNFHIIKIIDDKKTIKTNINIFDNIDNIDNINNINILIEQIKNNEGIINSAKMNYIFIEHKNNNGEIINIKYGNNKYNCIIME